MRLYPVTQGNPKQAISDTASIPWKGERVIIPRNARLTADTVGLHYSKVYWGADALTYNPDRWMRTIDQGSSKELYKPPKGTYIPFSEGIRACIGRPFAEAEFKGLLTTLFESYSIELIPQVDRRTGVVESWEQTQKRALKAMDGAKNVLTFGMLDLVPLRLVKREA